MAEVHIRTFRYPDDYASAVRIWQMAGAGVHVGASDVPAEIEKKLQRDPDLFLVAELDAGLVGTVIGGFDGRRGLVYHLAVSPALRRQGVASALMREVESRLKAKGCVRCYLLVRKDNADALAYYEKAGWSLLPDHVFAKDLVE